ncbi:MAG: hypothetical protein LBR14_02635 [Clostridiales Family XIII bacterium]|jgi:type 1 glutamine amidotransferase|nr:hypothetical protein [Clostridiales Family XIII bacterium]
MKKRILIVCSLVLTLALALGLSACEEQAVKMVPVQSTASDLTMSFPEDWSAQELNDLAAIQMGKAKTEEYLALFEFDATAFSDATLEDFANLVSEDMKTFISDADVGAWEDVTINGISALQTEVSGTIISDGSGDDVDVTYLVTVFRNDTGFYEALAWSVQNMYEDAKPDFEKILNTVTLP